MSAKARRRIRECMDLLEDIQDGISDREVIGRIVGAVWELHYARELLKTGTVNAKANGSKRKEGVKV